MLSYLCDLTRPQAEHVLFAFSPPSDVPMERLIDTCRSMVRHLHPYLSNPNMLTFRFPWNASELIHQAPPTMRRLDNLTRSQLDHVLSEFTQDRSVPCDALFKACTTAIESLHPETNLSQFAFCVPQPTLTDLPDSTLCLIYGHLNFSNDRKAFRTASSTLFHLCRPLALGLARPMLPEIQLREAKDSRAFTRFIYDLNTTKLCELEMSFEYEAGREFQPLPILEVVSLSCSFEHNFDGSVSRVLKSLADIFPSVTRLHIFIDGNNRHPDRPPVFNPLWSLRYLSVAWGPMSSGPHLSRLPLVSQSLSCLRLNVGCSWQVSIDSELFESCTNSLTSLSLEVVEGGLPFCVMDDISNLNKLESLTMAGNCVVGFNRCALRQGIALTLPGYGDCCGDCCML